MKIFKILFGDAPKDKTNCNCNKFEDQDIVLAKEFDELEYFKNFLKDKKYKYEFCEKEFEININSQSIITGECRISRRYADSLFIDGEETGFYIRKNTKLKKHACLSCNTCLGWYKEDNNHSVVMVNSPSEYFEKIIQDHFDQVEKRTQAMSLAKQREKLAKEICSEI